MSGGWPSTFELCNATDLGTVASASLGTIVTASATANTKGAYTQITASTPTDADWILVSLNLVGASNIYTAAIDIAIGPSGSELVVVPNLMTFTRSLEAGNQWYMIPCSIPAGTRIAARCQSSLASSQASVQVTTFQGNFADGSASGLIDAVGFIPTTTLGTAPTAGVNAQGSYTQLTAATANDYKGFFLGFDFQNATFGSVSYYHLLNLAIGPSGSEKVILPNLSLTVWATNSNNLTPSNSTFFPIQIPAGTRIAVSDSVSTSGSPAIGVTLYGVRA